MGYLSENAWRVLEKKRLEMTDTVRSTAPGRFKHLKHGKTHYQLHGDPTGPLLICIHGWTTASYVWKPLRQKFVDMGYYVLTYDLYGRNFSTRPNVSHTAELFTEQLDELLTALNLNERRMNIVGYSMGGAIAAGFVSKRLKDVDRLLLIAPAGMKAKAPRFRRIARENPKLFDPHILLALPLPLRWQFRRAAFGFGNVREIQEVKNKQFRELKYKGYVEALLLSLKGVLVTKMAHEHRLIAREKGIAVKALFADQDKTIPWPDAKRLFDGWNTNAESVRIEGATHELTYTHADLVFSHVQEFLELGL